jgi:hypothetical protein
MAGDSKLVEASGNRSRAWRSFNWFTPILWGVALSLLIGIPMIVMILLNQKGYLPSWVFGWVSNDRETQKHQFRLALTGLFAIWVATRFIKHGVFGEFVRTSYNHTVLRLKFVQGEREAEDHARFCGLINAQIAAGLVGFFALMVFMSWRELGKPFLEHNLYDLLFRIVLASMVFPVFLRWMRRLPERFILAIVTIRIATGFIFEYAPNLADPIADLVREGDLMLWTLALITSIGLLASSLSKSRLSA